MGTIHLSPIALPGHRYTFLPKEEAISVVIIDPTIEFLTAVRTFISRTVLRTFESVSKIREIKLK